MYVTEKYLKMEIKELREQLNSLANDLGGDIRFLHQELVDLREELQALREVVTYSRNEETDE